MLCSLALYTRKYGHNTDPQEATLAGTFWGPKKDLLQTTNFMNTTKLDVWEKTWKANKV